MKDITLTDSQYALWQASAEYREGFEAGVFAMVDPEDNIIRVYQPDGQTLVATATRATTWNIS